MTNMQGQFFIKKNTQKLKVVVISRPEILETVNVNKVWNVEDIYINLL